jgi:hypothetical protein
MSDKRAKRWARFTPEEQAILRRVHDDTSSKSVMAMANHLVLTTPGDDSLTPPGTPGIYQPELQAIIDETAATLKARADGQPLEIGQ